MSQEGIIDMGRCGRFCEGGKAGGRFARKQFLDGPNGAGGGRG